MLELFNIYRLKQTSSFSSFDCTNEDLNEFLINDAKNYLEHLLAVTYYIDNNGETVGYFSVLNDAIIKVDDISKNRWKGKILKLLPAEKRGYNSHPAVKVGRLGIDKKYQSKGIGSELMDFIKGYFIHNNKTGCRFITVDAENNPRTIEFYKRNDFDFLTDTDIGKDQRAMYFDLIRYAPYVDNI